MKICINEHYRGKKSGFLSVNLFPFKKKKKIEIRDFINNSLTKLTVCVSEISTSQSQNRDLICFS